MTSQLAIEDLKVPAALDTPEGTAFAQIQQLFRDAALQELGHDDLVSPDAVQLARMQPSPYGRNLLLVARSGADATAPVIAAAMVFLPQAENLEAADIDLVVAPQWRRQGVGTRLLDHAASVCAREGRTILNGYSELSLSFGDSVGAPGPGVSAVAPESGAGWVDASSASTAFARSCGFVLGQIERGSRVEIGPADFAVWDGLEREALAGSDGYETISWTGPVPEWAVDDYCRIIERMDTDPPAGGLEFEPSRWDATRLRTMEDRRRRQGTGNVVTVARHEATGRLVAYTELVVFAGRKDLAFQEGTLVLPEHRGHRLGQLAKARNHRELVRLQPAVERIYTWNAAENAYMLRINEALGFAACLVEPGWIRK
ncbi:GNAT family N-acetyltransferase [Arthrobacter rhombi]|uniref:GNAT family N-acetyltransferase n=1 Tax=Arthrobacter rhombi TaxID=71253 RepID=UPI0031DB90FF